MFLTVGIMKFRILGQEGLEHRRYERNFDG
jgi:hypothetical protein